MTDTPRHLPDWEEILDEYQDRAVGWAEIKLARAAANAAADRYFARTPAAPPPGRRAPGRNDAGRRP